MFTVNFTVNKVKTVLPEARSRFIMQAMAYERQQGVRRILNERIPRGQRDSAQRIFRFLTAHLLMRGYTFEDSVAMAIPAVREQHPGFEPTILPAN